jgi:NADPH:quinone reductase
MLGRMKAILAAPQGAQLADVPQPQPGPHDILVRVRAASLNRADLAALAAKDGKVIGMEWAGEVVRAGPEAGPWQPGDRVMCTGAGAFAEYAVTDGGRACRIPDSLHEWDEATVLPLALQAMHDALVTHGRLTPGNDVLIHGASSGVGLMGLQIARLLGARQVFGTGTHAGRLAQLGAFGADVSIDASQPGWHEHILAATGGKGVDVIVDQITGKDFASTFTTAAVGARVVNLGRLGGAAGEFDFQWHALRRISYTGVTFRTRSAQEIRALNARMLADLGDAIAARKLSLPIDSRFALAQAGQALARMAANQHFGKIVLTPS